MFPFAREDSLRVKRIMINQNTLIKLITVIIPLRFSGRMLLTKQNLIL